MIHLEFTGYETFKDWKFKMKIIKWFFILLFSPVWVPVGLLYLLCVCLIVLVLLLGQSIGIIEEGVDIVFLSRVLG